MIVVTGIAEIAPEDVSQIKSAAKIMASASRSEEGCRNYAFYEDIEQEGRFRIYEEWETAEALREHFTTQHMQDFNQILSETKVLKLEVDQFLRGDDIKVG